MVGLRLLCHNRLDTGSRSSLLRFTRACNIYGDTPTAHGSNIITFFLFFLELSWACHGRLNRHNYVRLHYQITTPGTATKATVPSTLDCTTPVCDDVHRERTILAEDRAMEKRYG